MSEIIILGDIAFTGILSTEPEKNKERYKEVTPVLSKVDLVFANLEVPIKVDDSQNDFKKFIHYSLPKPTKDLLKMLNISCVSLANNHIYDCKMSGLKATISMLDKLGIYHTGAGWLPEHIKPAIIEHKQTKIGFLAYVDQSTNPKTENFPELYINYFSKAKVIEDIKKLEEFVDKLIVSIHWGVDYSHYQTPEQIKTARTLIDAGADIIMGHHPHTLQPFEKYNDGFIFYSIGGLTFGDYMKPGKNKLQALFKKTKRGLITQYDLPSNDFTFIVTKELKGNFIKLTKQNYKKWSEYKWKLYKIALKYPLLKKWIGFKEKILDRVIEYFFGYYQHPLKRLFQFNNLKKFKQLIF